MTPLRFVFAIFAAGAALALGLGHVVVGAASPSSSNDQPNPADGSVPVLALQAEMVAQLHSFIGPYKPVKVGGLSDSSPPKEISVGHVTLVSADAQFLYVRFAVKIREKFQGAVLYTLDGNASGKFRLAEVKPDKLSLYSQIGTAFSDLTITSVNIPRISGPQETEGARRSIRSNFPPGIWVPLYPTLTIANANAEELILYPGKPGPVPNTIRFTVKLSNLSARVVSLHYQTADGSAKAGLDYGAASGTLTIQSLSPTGTISVGLRRRNGYQGDRTFALNLSNLMNGTLSTTQVQGLIIDYPE